MFLAIAVDNLATAQELTAEQEAAEALAKEEKENNVAKEVTMFLPSPTQTTAPSNALTETGTAQGTPAKGNAKNAKTT